MKVHSHDEELLEPIARYLRFKISVENINTKKPAIIADLGCGPKIRFYNYSSKKGVKFKKYIGIDPLITKDILEQYKDTSVIQLVKNPLTKKIPLANNSVDYVVAFAFLEHVDNPEEILNDSIRVLKKGGKAIFTTPSYTAKIVLEFLAFKLGLISPREIAEHKNYFNKSRLTKMVQNPRVSLKHTYFELGMNNLFIITKK